MPAPAKVVEQICVDSDSVVDTTVAMPEGALVISKQDGSKVEFTVSLAWAKASGMAVLSRGKELESSCTVMGNVGYGYSEKFVGGCIEGSTSVTVVAYMDEGFDPEECEACNVDDLEAMGGEYSFCAYRIELPC